MNRGFIVGNGLGTQTGYVVRASRVMARDPAAAAERIRGRLDRRHDRAEMRLTGRSTDELYPIDQNWLANLHEALGQPWPCDCAAAAAALYAEVMADFAARGLPERYDGWCDGGRAFTTAAWCLAVHLSPRNVVETGVARGVTSRFLLEAFARNGSGRLASVDLPSVDSRLHGQIGAAVPEQLRDRWTLVTGTSRQRLPGVLAEVGQVDLFVHDSLHTGSNVRFELDRAWAAITPGGAMLVDDVYQSLAFRQFVDVQHPRFACVAANPDGSYRFGVILRDGGPAGPAPSLAP